MASWKIISFLLILCSFYHSTSAQEGLKCNLTGAKKDKDFPDLETEGVLSYQLSVEFTLPNSAQTDFYIEYYDILNRQGRVDSHIGGKTSRFIYLTSSSEAFEIADRNCKLLELTDTPEYMKDSPNDWLYVTGDDSQFKRGPSAMFQHGLVAWKKATRSSTTDMAYMGKSDTQVRGLDAQYWRRCISDTYFVDYYFTTDEHEDSMGFNNLHRIPLRVEFSGVHPVDDKKSMPQHYDIFSFQNFVSDVDAWELPTGYGCERGDGFTEGPDLPDFTNKNLMFFAEVVYRNFDQRVIWSLYSNLMMALDLETQHVAYFYTEWNQTKRKEDTDIEPTAYAPEFVVFDMKHDYVYKIHMETGACEVSREGKYVPRYHLPNGGGYIDLTDPAILFTNNELSYITEDKDRGGLGVHVFEGTFPEFDLGTRKVQNARVTHMYLKDNEVERNTVSIKDALTRVQLRWRTPEKNREIVTFSFYGFTTQIYMKNYIFDISECFKNDDEYIWVTFGFPADPPTIESIQQDIPSIQANILTAIQRSSELNAIRMPTVLVDFSDGLYVTILILSKPPLLLDYLGPEKGRTIDGTKDVDGIVEFDDCAKMCLETKDECWGFSICGNTCYFGTASSPSATITEKVDCTLYRRYDNSTYLMSMDTLADNLRSVVQAQQMRLTVNDKDDNQVNLIANYIEITKPGSDEELFNRLGNERSPRFAVKKVSSKLKAGTNVKNLGRLSFAECQKVCLDFKECETISYCLDSSECIITKAYGEDIPDDNFEEKSTCIVLARKYADNFVRSPGNVLSTTATKVLDSPTAEECARECLKATDFTCMSFDHCANVDKGGCLLHAVYYPNAQTREAKTTNNSNCGHYYKRYSQQFRVTYEKKTIASDLPIMTNITLEECAKACLDYGKGTCYGYDFCQDASVYATGCILLDKHPGQLKTTYSGICNNYIRDVITFSPSSYSKSFTGGIGFLCFLVGGLVGAGVVFVIAYIRVNRRQ